MNLLKKSAVGAMMLLAAIVLVACPAAVDPNKETVEPRKPVENEVLRYGSTIPVNSQWTFVFEKTVVG